MAIVKGKFAMKVAALKKATRVTVKRSLKGTSSSSSSKAKAKATAKAKAKAKATWCKILIPKGTNYVWLNIQGEPQGHYCVSKDKKVFELVKKDEGVYTWIINEKWSEQYAQWAYYIVKRQKAAAKA